MGERINYSVTVNSKEKAVIKDLYDCIVENFVGSPNILESDFENDTTFFVEDGWRGGGESCEELLRKWLSDFFKKYPKLNIEVECEYVEHCPVETILIYEGDDD